ncbi:hypothetical protein PR001_g6089 [Phytophthora rubi]|uniref:PiggyBac transposable element-derived protein domain-containing protein n=1 Tax=Phytophthora rubi TaxID=129364 RepID=A0A6A3NQF5_9STRA|nr:hypothetical protein PR001_g6089 [Phytophthora rubi]
MDRGANQCTALNSDEDPDLREEPEDEEDADDDSWTEDWDIGELSDEELDEVPEELPDSVWLSAARDSRLMSSMRHDGWEYDPSKFGPDPTYEGLYDGPYGPSDSVLNVAEDPLALLFYFLPPKLWSQIAVESNTYHAQSIPLRARAIRFQQRRNGGEVEDLGEIRRRLSRVPDIEGWEVLRVMGLLIARMLVPIRKGIAAHWSLKKVGALPTNRFNLFMTKNRFFHIMGYLHFSNNKSPQAKIEIYCGAKTHLQTPVPKDNNTGEAAVVRNMNALLPPSPTAPWRLVVTDRFYTSVKLALELLHRRMYITGTIQCDRAGYAPGVVTAKKYKTINKRKFLVPPQGTIRLAENKQFAQITACMWMDRNPVHMLSSGGSRVPGTVMRRIQGEVQPHPAPELVRDYHRWMGGVDVNDQLRMQRYSVQLCYKTRKYYKTLFFGLFDMALVNAFIVFRHHKKANNKRPAKHSAFFEELMEQLLAIDSAEAFKEIEEATSARDRIAPSPARSESRYQPSEGVGGVEGGHLLEENPDTVDSDKYLCNVVREGREKTCFQIWHQDWSNGNDIPRLLLQDHKVRDRAPPSRPNKKRRSSGQSHHDAPTRADSEGSVDEDSEDSCVMNAGSERAGGNGGGVTGDES